MSLAILVLLAFTIPLFLLGIIPCLGGLNWIAVPLAASTALLGLIGLIADRDPNGPSALGGFIYIVGLVAGVLIAVIGSLRCMLGGFVF